MNLALPHAPIVVFAGPPKAGNHTVISSIADIFPGYDRGASLTNRPEQPGDHPGEYIHVTPEEIQAAADRDEVLEVTEVDGYIFASIRPDPARPTILDLDVEGATALRKSLNGTEPIIFIIVLPTPYVEPHLRELHSRNASVRWYKLKYLLRDRLSRRSDASEEEINRQVELAMSQISDLEANWKPGENVCIIRNVEGKQEDAITEVAKILSRALEQWYDLRNQAQIIRITYLEDQLRLIN